MNRYDRNLQVIYVAIVTSAIVYAVVAWAATRDRMPVQRLADELREPVAIALLAGAAACIVAAAVIRVRRLLVMRWVLLDAACIFGVVLAFLFTDFRLFVMPWAAALVGFIALYPRVRMVPR